MEKIEVDNLNLWGLYQWGFWPVHRLAIVPILVLDFLPVMDRRGPGPVDYDAARRSIGYGSGGA